MLRTGDVTTLLTDDTNKIYAYARTDASAPACAIAIFNRGTSTQNVTLTNLPAACAGTLEDVLNGGADWTIGGGSLTVNNLAGLSSAVLVPAFDNPNTSDATASLPPVSTAVNAAASQVATNGSTTIAAVVRDTAGQTPARRSDGELCRDQRRRDGGRHGRYQRSRHSHGHLQRPATGDVAVIQASITAPSGVVYSDAATVFVGNNSVISSIVTTQTGIGPQTITLPGVLHVTKMGLGEPVLTLAQLDNVPNSSGNYSPYVDVHLSMQQA
ncbi:MAG: hypothetical protein IPK53_08435 [bacterium]|nr:hypothetical protein [bacterium]